MCGASDECPKLAQVQAKLAASELAAGLAAQAAAASPTDSNAANAGERAPPGVRPRAPP